MLWHCCTLEKKNFPPLLQLLSLAIDQLNKILCHLYKMVLRELFASPLMNIIFLLGCFV